MSFLSSQPFLQQEERTTRYLCPRRMVLSGGKVENAGQLLSPSPLQIDLSEPQLTALVNPAGETERAWVLLDFGFEFHGGIRLLTHGVGPAIPKPGNALAQAQVRLTFGESVSEAMSELVNTLLTEYISNFVVCGLKPQEQYENLKENFSASSVELLEDMAEKIRQEVMADKEIASANRNKEIIQRLYKKGVYNMKDAVGRTAEILGISKNTVYMHLRNLEDI